MSHLQKLLPEPISAPESEKLERKLEFGQEVSEAIAAMLNTQGGWVVVGVDDSGDVKGVSHADAALKQFQAKLSQQLMPPALWSASIVPVEGREVVVVEVPPGAERPYTLNGRILVRRGPATVTPTGAEITQIIRRRQGSDLRWERQIALGVDVSDLEAEEINSVLNSAEHRGEHWQGPEAFLSRMGLVRDGSVTNAGVILFHPSPAELFPQARLRFTVFSTEKTGSEYIEDRVIEGPLLRLSRELEGQLRRYAGVRSSFGKGWQRQDYPTLPMASLREGILNALIHRNYSSVHGGMTVSLYYDRCEIWNYGALPEGLTPSDLAKAHPSLPPNPDIAHVAYLAGYIEKLGRGTQKIVDECRQLKLPSPSWTTGPTGTRLAIPLVQLEPGDLSLRSQRILGLLQSREALSLSQMIGLLEESVSDRTIRKDLEQLLQAGLIHRRGKGKSTYYVAKEHG